MVDLRRHQLSRNLGCLAENTRIVLITLKGIFERADVECESASIEKFIKMFDIVLGSSAAQDIRYICSCYFFLLKELIAHLSEKYRIKSQKIEEAFRANWSKACGEFINLNLPGQQDTTQNLNEQMQRQQNVASNDKEKCRRCLFKNHMGTCKLQCYKCRSVGIIGAQAEHLARDCPRIKCGHCGVPGHKDDACPRIGDLPLCHRCFMPGHKYKNCVNPVRCYICWEFEHISSYCPSIQK
uniref:CCHC-type domain-containing protein n=1 Tax=Panagrolaimus sp. ES5 TaxID=591445 RepID=A0AC34G3S3_9BILA